MIPEMLVDMLQELTEDEFDTVVAAVKAERERRGIVPNSVELAMWDSGERVAAIKSLRGRRGPMTLRECFDAFQVARLDFLSNP